jgi:DNA-binding MurR/RpiR family transcriptional regulator
MSTSQHIQDLEGGGESVNKPEEEIISAAEFARRLGVDRSAVTRYVRTGKLQPYSNEYRGLKRQPKFRASDVERIKDMRQIDPSGPALSRAGA